MKDRSLLIGFVFFIFLIFIFNSYVSDVGKAASGRFCADSDEGVKIYTAGKVVSDIGTFNDKCFDNLRQIREYYCVEGRHGGSYQVESKVVSCGAGYSCVRDVVGESDACDRKN